VTSKERPFSVRLRVVRSIGEELREAWRLGWRFVLVLGGGSYGHVVASEYMREGLMDTGEALASITRVMAELSSVVSEVLAEYGLAPVVYPPYAFCRPDGLRPNCDWELVSRSLWYDATPLIPGDAYPGYSGVRIVSGDELAIEASCRLGADVLVYATNVPGVLDERGETIPYLSRPGLHDLLEHGMLRGGSGVDVTGGMYRKLKVISELGCPGLRVCIVEGSRPGSVYAALRGRVSRGMTVIEL